MTKQILMDYIDACELIKETEEDIRKLRKQEIVHDKVKDKKKGKKKKQ